MSKWQISNKSARKWHISNKSAQKIKFRAECQIDVAKLMILLQEEGKFFRIMEWKIFEIGTDVVITAETDFSIKEIVSVLNHIADSHVMLETIALECDYTGRR